MPKKARVTDKQRAKIAAGVASGKSKKAIGDELGLARETVSRQVNHPVTQTIIHRAKEKYGELTEALLAQGLIVCGAAMRSRTTDTDTKLRAFGKVLAFATAGDPVAARIEAPGEYNGDFTLEEALLVYRRIGAPGA